MIQIRTREIVNLNGIEIPDNANVTCSIGTYTIKDGPFPYCEICKLCIYCDNDILLIEDIRLLR